MMFPGRRKVVVLGLMSKMPFPGVVWQTMHYLIGFQRLGYDVYYVEAHGIPPKNFIERKTDDGVASAAAYIDSVLRQFDLGDRWAYHAPHEGNRYLGMSESELRRIYAEADLIINLHGGTIPLPEHSSTGRLIYLETDPVEVQIQLHEQQADTIAYLEPHVAFFTFGENYGRPDCGLPLSDRFHFRPTRQPVVMDFWKTVTGGGDMFTTVGNWKQAGRDIRFRGNLYHWSKHHEFLKFLDLPARSGQAFELALSRTSLSDTDAAMLTGRGWRVRDALKLSDSPDAYRQYIQDSRGEFTVAKDQNVRLRTGWFSDRSATYLASGRPVITQDTGFGNILPNGEGLFAFQEMDEIIAAVEQVNTDYGRQSEAASRVAQDHFDHEVVLRRLLGDLGLTVDKGSTSRPLSNALIVVPASGQHPDISAIRSMRVR